VRKALFVVLIALAIRESLTVERSSSPGHFLLQKLIKSIKHRCHPILLDANINRVWTVRLNVYQMFLFCAIKFHFFVKTLPQGVERNPKFFIGNVTKILV
jgi:hypothetical protein